MWTKAEELIGYSGGVSPVRTDETDLRGWGGVRMRMKRSVVDRDGLCANKYIDKPIHKDQGGDDTFRTLV